MTNNVRMPKSAQEIVTALGGTNSAARFFGVKPPSVSGWLTKNVIPDERLMPFAARLEIALPGQFRRIDQWPDTARDIWPDLEADQSDAVSEST
ncbi:hypothetical protein ABL849_17405 [Variovorax sp. 375MFSha3.1]|uniref:hypothetical protein n=1 Tax=Variovorax sp. 375MFSha3.1 TaxID=3158364 RepID=UPI003AAAF52E